MHDSMLGGSTPLVISEQLHTDPYSNATAFDGWDLDYTQLSAGAYTCRWKAIQLPALKFYMETGNALVHQCGRAKPGTLIFGIPLEMNGEGAFNGRPWRGGIEAFSGEQCIDVVVPSMSLLMIEVDRHAFVEHCWLTKRVRADNWLERRWLHLEDSVQCREIAARLSSILRVCEGNPEVLAHPESCRFVEQAVFDILMPLTTDHADPPRPSYGEFSRMQVMRRARDYIMAHIDEPVQIGDVCRALGVSRRTLQNSFQETLNVNPVAYLRLLRLNGVRRDLCKSPGSSAQVKDIAARWGFWHLSRFSNDYRHMFNERPSDTLRSAGVMRSRVATRSMNDCAPT